MKGRAMDFDALKTFVAIARLGGFGRAATALHRSQPAISRRIEMLEEELGAPLFERLRTGILLTDAGTALLPHAQSALAAAKDGATAVTESTNGAAGHVSLALVGTLADERLTRALREFRDRRPHVTVDVQTATTRIVARLVQVGDATLGLRYLDESVAGLVSQTMAHEKMVVVCGASHRLAGKRRRIGDLAGERWVMFPVRAPRESLAQFLQLKLAAAGVAAPEIVPIDSLVAQKRLVEAGFGLALLARRGVSEELRRGSLAIVDVPALRMRIPITLVRRRNGYLGPAAQNLMAALTAVWHATK